MHIQSHGKVRVTGGPGDDVIMARGGRDSLVEGGDGNDVIGTFGRRNVLESRTRYRGGEGRNTFGLVDHGKADQVMDFDPAKDEFHTPE